MDRNTVIALNKISEQFYHKVGVEFDRTRQQYWEGWEQVLPFVNQLQGENNTLSVLDVACGNARFGRFVAEHFPEHEVNYQGLEREPQLLAFSEDALSKTHLQYDFQQIDIIESLQDDTFVNFINQKFDLIMVFGLLHHVPSQLLRSRLISNLSSRLTKNGLLVITSWQFAHLPRFSERFVVPETFGIDSSQLEENDYILDWQRVEKAYRYCHYANQEELVSLVENNTDCTVLDSFYADGKTHQLNCYVVCKKET